MLIANMMPKFALNRNEESISPLSFHSNSSSSSNLSYQKRYQDGGREAEGGGGYSNSRYYYNKYDNKYKNYDDNQRIIYKTTGANANGNNNNNIRFLKKAYNSKYENQESSVGLISNKNILENSSRVITAADHRNSKKIFDLNEDDKKEDETKKFEKNNNEETAKEEANSKEERPKTDLKNLPDDITNRLDDMFNDLNLNQLLPDKGTEERESSRFSKWFTVSKDEAKEVKAPENNNNEGAFPQSVESEKYFQPIDKVESNSLFQLLKSPEKEDNPLMQHAMQQKHVVQQKSPNSGQVHSVEELEARLRQHKVVDDQKNTDDEQRVLQNFFQQQLAPQQHQEDVNNFKKLLSQMTGDENKMQGQGQNLLQQMMNKSFPQQSAAGGMMQQPKMPVKMPAPHMLQQQQGQFDMMKFLHQQKVPPVPQVPQVEVMKRPEVQSLVQGKTVVNLWSSIDFTLTLF